MQIVDVLSAASSVLAASVAVGSFIFVVRSAQQTTRAKETLRTVDLREAIDALDRPALRRVLHGELGSVRVSDYVSNEAIRSRFDELIAEVAHFVAEPEEPQNPPDSTELVVPRPEERVPPELSREYEDLVKGDSWAALARLRRTLETRLTSMLGDETGKSGKARSAGQQLRRLRSLGRIDEDWYRRLEYAISVCNAAVHGEDVSMAQAAEVFDIAARWIETTRA